MILYLSLLGIVQWLGCIFITQQLARAKGYDTEPWTAGAVFFGPLALIAIAGSPLIEENHFWKVRRIAKTPSASSVASDAWTRRCSECQGINRENATVCMKCGKPLKP